MKIKTSIMIDGTCTIHECAYKHVELFVRNTIKHPDRHTDNVHSDIHIHKYKYIPGTHTRTHTHTPTRTQAHAYPDSHLYTNAPIDTYLNMYTAYEVSKKYRAHQFLLI